MRILIAGAGIGGLYAAHLLGKNGHSVTVYEKIDAVENMRYDWHDDITQSVFKRLGLTIPEGSYEKSDWVFVSPGGHKIALAQNPDNIDYSIERRPLNKYLYDLACETAEVKFGVEAVGAVCEGSRVVGLKFSDGTEEKCDLVIDSCGVLSKVRRSLPDSFGVSNDVEDKGVFVAYRAYFNAVPGVEVTDTNKAYLKHRGEAGISWCLLDHDPTLVDVLVGRIGKLTDTEVENAMADLRAENPVLGEELKRGGMVATIPVRRPLAVFVCDGYAAIGDAACMTVPLIGSGIATSLLAAKHLADTVGESQTADAALLWKYEYACYAEFGIQHWGVEYMKNWLLACPSENIDWLMGSGVLTSEDMASAGMGGMIKLTAKQVFEKMKIGIKNLPVMCSLVGMILKSSVITSAVKRIPKEYDREAVERWADRITARFTGKMY